MVVMASSKASSRPERLCNLRIGRILSTSVGGNSGYVVEILEELKSGTGLAFETDSDAAHFVDMLKLDPPTDQEHSD